MTPTTEIQLANYTLEQEIGRGDLTITYRGHRNSDRATVAIKVVAPQFTFDRLFVQRFKDMARQAAKLEHRNIVAMFEAGEEGNTVYVVRELIDARPLTQVIEEEGTGDLYLIECNARFGGGSVLSIQAGFDMVEMIKEEYPYNEKAAPCLKNTWRPGVKMRRYYSEYYI